MRDEKLEDGVADVSISKFKNVQMSKCADVIMQMPVSLYT